MSDNVNVKWHWSGPGCITTIVTLFAIWALLFGVTYQGRHYGLHCSCANGVEVQR